MSEVKHRVSKLEKQTGPVEPEELNIWIQQKFGCGDPDLFDGPGGVVKTKAEIEAHHPDATNLLVIYRSDPPPDAAETKATVMTLPDSWQGEGGRE